MLSWCYSINVWTNTQKLILHKDCPVFTIWGKLFFLPRVKTQEKLNSKWNNNFVSHKTESKLKTAFLNFLQRLSNVLFLTGELIIINPIYCDSANALQQSHRSAPKCSSWLVIQYLTCSSYLFNTGPDLQIHSCCSHADQLNFCLSFCSHTLLTTYSHREALYKYRPFYILQNNWVVLHCCILTCFEYYLPVCLFVSNSHGWRY